MSRIKLGLLGLLVFVPALWALDDPKEKVKPKSSKAPTAEEAYQAIEKEYQKAQQGFFKAFQEAKTAEEKQKAFAKYPKPQEYAPRFLEIAEKYPKDPVADKALTWLLQNGPYTPQGQKAVEMLFKKVEDNPKDPAAEKTLTLIVQFASYTPAGQKAAGILFKKVEDNPKDPASEKTLAMIVQHATNTEAGQKAMGILLKRAEENPKDPESVKNLITMVQRASYTNEGKKALELVLKDHIQSKDIGPVCQSLLYSEKPEEKLQEIIDKNPHKEVQGQAVLTLAQVLKRQSEGVASDKEKAAKEAENMLQLATEKYGEVMTPQGKVADQAKALAEEIRLFGYGRPLPDIEGEDIDGKKFKINDYLGKVVLLDFWGNW